MEDCGKEGEEMMIPQRKDKIISKWVVIGVFACLVFSTFLFACMHSGKTVNKSQANPVYIRVDAGMNAEKIAGILHENKIIDSVVGFKIIAKLNGLDGRLRAGNYTFYQGMKYRDIIDDLVNGKVSAITVMIPEGYNVDQIAELFEKKGLFSGAAFKKEAKQFRPFDYIHGDVRAKYTVEGFLFPDTYEFSSEATVQDILRTMAEEFDSKFTPEMSERAAALNLTVEEVVILASLVEKEAQVDADRPVIAQVFMNRLREAMPLQSCATIQYILGNPKAELSVQDTKIESDYNTYQHMGLPPGPIANPGIASIKAVLFAPPTEYLYFVADKNGKHHFSRTYEEHLRAIDRIESNG